MAAATIPQSTALPFVEFSEIRPTLGAKIGEGDNGIVHAVKDSAPPRVYKIISGDIMNSREARIAEIAGRVGVGPAVHRSFITEQGQRMFTFIEMDHAGKTLGTHMEEVAEAQAEAEAEPEEELTPEESARREMIERIEAKLRAESRFTIVEIEVKPRATIEEAVDHLYDKAEDFYFELFSRIRTLAEANISYGDTHVGNILPNPGTDSGVQLIDFDRSAEHESESAAAAKSLESAYTFIHFKNFRELPDLSPRSEALIQYFRA